MSVPPVIPIIDVSRWTKDEYAGISERNLASTTFNKDEVSAPADSAAI